MTEADIASLYAKFAELDVDGSGTLTKEDLRQLRKKRTSSPKKGLKANEDDVVEVGRGGVFQGA